MDCQSNSVAQGYFDLRGSINGLSGDCQSDSGVRGYSDIEGGYRSDYPRMVWEPSE